MAENGELTRLQDISRRLAELHVRIESRFAELNARQRALLEEVTRRRDERRMAEIRKSIDGSVEG